MKQVAAVRRVGNISVPNQPMYRRFSVLVIQLANCSQRAMGSFLETSGDSVLTESSESTLKGLNSADFFKSVVDVPLGAKFKDVELPAKLDLDFDDADGMGTVKASQVEAMRAKTAAAENFMIG